MALEQGAGGVEVPSLRKSRAPPGRHPDRRSRHVRHPAAAERALYTHSTQAKATAPPLQRLLQQSLAAGGRPKKTYKTTRGGTDHPLRGPWALRSTEICFQTVGSMSSEQELWELAAQLQKATGVPGREPLRQFLKLVGWPGRQSGGAGAIGRLPAALPVGTGRTLDTPHAAVPGGAHPSRGAGGALRHDAAAAPPQIAG
jgi:hypothetical protein